MEITEKVKEDSKLLVKKLREEEGRDFSKEIEAVEVRILAEWDILEKARRLKHIPEASASWTSLERLYIEQSSFRANQIKATEQIKQQLRELHGDYIDRWIGDLREDTKELLKKRVVRGEPDFSAIDRITMKPMWKISYNIQSVAIGINKVLGAIKKLTEAADCDTITNLGKIYESAHAVVNQDFGKMVEEVGTEERFDFLVASTKTEIPKNVEMSNFEAIIESDVGRMVGTLESIKSHLLSM